MAEANWNAEEGAGWVIPCLNKEIEAKFQSLLETKHLYQKVVIDWQKIVDAVKGRVMSWAHPEFFANIRGVPGMQFTLVTQVLSVARQGVLGAIPLVLLLKNATMFCRVCDRREAFRPILYKDLAVELRQLPAAKLVRHLPVTDTFQDFVLVYQCQHCEGVPETFISLC